MNDKIRFTKTVLEAVTCPPDKDRVYLYDTHTPGLEFRLTRTGSASFYVYRWANGRPQRVRLGGFPDLSVEQARKQAAGVLADFAKGIDPGEARRQARASETFGDVFTRYIEQHAKPHKKTWKEDEAKLERYLSDWKGRKVARIAQADVRALHTRIGTAHGHYAANRLLALLSTVFAKTGAVGADGTNPAKGVQRFKEAERERFLHPDELPKFFQALADEPNITSRDFFLVSLLTGARRGNVQAMEWGQVNLDRATWDIPDTKNGSPLTIPLAPQVVNLLRGRRETAREKAEREAKERSEPMDPAKPPAISPYVFPARHGESGHLTEPKKAWANILKRAGIANLRMHDLRRTLGSFQASAGASLPIIGRSLGHKSLNSTKIYARLTFDPVRQSVNVATAALTQNAEATALLDMTTPRALPAPGGEQ